MWLHRHAASAASRHCPRRHSRRQGRLVEKTFTATVAGAEEVTRPLGSAKSSSWRRCGPASSPAIVAARALIDEGAIGESGSYKLILVWTGPTTLPTGCSTWPRAAARCSTWASTWCPSRSTSSARPIGSR